MPNMNNLKNKQILIFPGTNTSPDRKPSSAAAELSRAKADIEKLYVELMYCRSESAVAELKFVTYLLDLACEALREALPPDDVELEG